MLMHENFITGQFYELKNDLTSMMHRHYHHLNHQLPHHQNAVAARQQLQLQDLMQRSASAVPSSPMRTLKMDLYTAYAYQQRLQQPLGTAAAASEVVQPSEAVATEVLDLSRRCDSVETPRKTPSPYQTNLSYSSGSPVASPRSASFSTAANITLANTSISANTLIPANLLCSNRAQHCSTPALLAGCASLYPALCYVAGNIKQEHDLIKQTTSTTAPVTTSSYQSIVNHQDASQLLGTNATTVTASILQTFAASSADSITVSAGATALPEPISATMQVHVTDMPHSPSSVLIDRIPSSSSEQQPSVGKSSNAVNTPTSSTATPALATINATSTRPFKAFPRDPFVIAATFAASDVLLDNPRVERFTDYRKRVVDQILNSNSGARTVTNPKMRRTNTLNGGVNAGSASNNKSECEDRVDRAEESSDCDSNAGIIEKLSQLANAYATKNKGDASSAINSASAIGQVKDAAYYERRRKNNAAAKKSRDRRRIKEDEIAIRAAFLERQNIELLCQIDSLKAQLAEFTSKGSV